MSVTETLKRNSPRLWLAATTHPFIDELGLGTLPRAKFRRYFIQDYVFLRDLVKVSALAVAKAPDTESARTMGGFLNVLLGAEDALFVRAFRSLRVTEKAWREADPSPVTAAFGDYLVSLAYSGTFREVCCALYVTEGVYLEWAGLLRKRGARPGVRIYQEWLDIHSEEALGPTVRFLEGVVNGSTRGERPSLQRIFDQTCRYEAAFWDMAYEGN
jgi:thiaminase/transcriptional activator TenA